VASSTQSLILDILLRDRASEGLSKAGMAARDAGVNVDSLQRKLTELGRKTAEARVKLEGDKDAQASLDKIDYKLLSLDRRTSSARVTVEGVARATAELAALDIELDKVGSKNTGSAAEAAQSFAMLAGPSAMGAAIAAGVALSPVIATLGLGLGGLALAALAAGKNSKQLKDELAPLKAEFAGFSKSLQPEILSIFGRGAQIAGHFLHDLLPVTAATGKALDELLGRVDAEFQSGTWQQFFGWMAREAGPDMKLVGDNFISLMNSLPLIIEDLQPLATGFLKVTNAVLGLPAAIAKVNAAAQQKTGADQGGFWGGTGLQRLTQGLSWLEHHLPAGNKSLSDLVGLTGQAAKVTDTAGKSFHAAGLKAITYQQQLDQVRYATKLLMDQQNTALNTQLAYGNSLVTAANDAVTLKQKLHDSRGEIGLQTQAQRDSFQAANTYIGDLASVATNAYKSGHGVDAAIAAISAGLPTLDSAKTKNREYWQEVATLKGWLDKLRAEKAISENIKLIGAGRWVVTGGPDAGTVRAMGGHTAKGWLVSGGTPGTDSVPIMAMPGELVVPTAMVRAGLVDHLKGTIPGFAAGGVVGSYDGSLSGLQPWGAQNWAASKTQISVAMADVMSRAAAAWIAGASSSLAAAGGGGNVGAWIAASLGINRLPGSWAPLMRILVQKESAGNPNAYNPISVMRYHAEGIAQMLPTTFAAYMMAGHGNIWNPVDNLISSERYIRAIYGSPAGIAGLTGGPYYGYDQGGYLPPGLSMAWNGTGHPEPVGAAGGTVVNITVNVPPTVNPREAGRQVAQLILAHTKAGGRLYPSGVTAR